MTCSEIELVWAGTTGSRFSEAAGREAAAVLLEQDAVAAGRHLGARSLRSTLRGAAVGPGGPLCTDSSQPTGQSCRQQGYAISQCFSSYKSLMMPCAS